MVISSVFRFLCGGLILREVAVLTRHARNISLFCFAKEHQGVSGQVRYERWLSYHVSSVELLSFAVLFVIVYLLTGSMSFLGGAVLTAVTGLKHSKLSRTSKEKSRQQTDSADS